MLNKVFPKKKYNSNDCIIKSVISYENLSNLNKQNYLSSFALDSYVFIIISKLVVSGFFYRYKTKKIFYLQKVYTFFKSLLVYKTIVYWDSVVPWASYYSEKSKMLLTNNFLS